MQKTRGLVEAAVARSAMRLSRARPAAISASALASVPVASPIAAGYQRSGRVSAAPATAPRAWAAKRLQKLCHLIAGWRRAVGIPQPVPLSRRRSVGLTTEERLEMSHFGGAGSRSLGNCSRGGCVRQVCLSTLLGCVDRFDVR